MQNEQLSKCCQATITVFTGSEGTNHWICARCGQPCDPMKNESTMNTVNETALGYFLKHKGMYSQADVEKLLATARAEGVQEKNEMFEKGYKHGKLFGIMQERMKHDPDLLEKSLKNTIQALTTKENT